MRNENNWAEFVGTIGEDKQLEYKVNEISFYRIVLYVKRLSGISDEIPMIVNEKILEQCDVHEGLRVKVSGEIRRRRNMDENGYHVKIFVYVTDMNEVSDTEQDKNEVFLSGIIYNPNLRNTFKGTPIVDFSIITSLKRLWCIAWFEDAYAISKKHNGDEIAIYGRFQSRIYGKVLKNGTREPQITYEISSTKLVK